MTLIIVIYPENITLGNPVRSSQQYKRTTPGVQHCSSNIKDQLLCSIVCWKYPQLSLSQIPKERCGMYVSQFMMVTPGGYL